MKILDNAHWVFAILVFASVAYSSTEVAQLKNKCADQSGQVIELDNKHVCVKPVQLINITK